MSSRKKNQGRKTKSWGDYVYGPIGQAEYDRFVLDIRQPGADIEALKLAMRDRAHKHLGEGYEGESAVYALYDCAEVAIMEACGAPVTGLMSDIAAADGRRKLVEKARAELAEKPHGIDDIRARVLDLMSETKQEPKATRSNIFGRLLSLARST